MPAPITGPPPASKTNWADEVENDDFPPRSEEFVDKDGIKTVIEYKTNEQGQKIKVTRRIKRTLKTSKVDHVVAERKGWAKFGMEKGRAPGPNTDTTTVGENISVKLRAGGRKEEAPAEEVDEAAKLKAQLAGKQVKCRLCQGDHFTSRCPYKDTLGDVAGITDAAAGTDLPADLGTSAAPGKPGKYVPPSMREGGNKLRGETMYGKTNRDELPTLRITNLSEDATESDLWDLFRRIPTRSRITRIHVGMDQETGLCKGYAFVSFEDRKDAEDAMSKIHGMSYDHLILSCAWSLPRGERAGGQ